MFELPRYVIKSGRIIVEQGDIRQNHFGKTFHIAPEFDQGSENDIRKWFEQYYSIRFRNYPVSADYLHDAEKVICE